MIVKVIRHWQELMPVAAQWDLLAALFLSPILSFNWVLACARACPRADALHVVLVYDGDDLVAAAPMMYCDRSRTPALRFIGNPYCELYEPNGLIYRDRRALKALIDALFSFGIPLVFEKLETASPAAEVLMSSTRRTLRMPVGRSRCLFVDADGDWESFEKKLSKPRRDRLKSMRKIADKMGPVRFDIVSPDRDQVGTMIGLFMAVESRSWKFRTGTALVQNEIQQAFLRGLAEGAAERENFRVFSMWIGDDLAAMRLAVVHAERLWEIKIGYDERFRRCSPGLLLTHETIKNVFRSGLKGHEFLGLEEDWEHLWTDHGREYVWLATYPPTLAGVAGWGEAASRLLWDKAGKILRRVQKPSAGAALGPA